MDDGILLAKNKDEASSMLNILEKVCEECGLKLNKQKFKMLISHNKDKLEKLDNIGAVEEITY